MSKRRQPFLRRPSSRRKPAEQPAYAPPTPSVDGSNAAAQQSLDEHTVFVRGTFSERIERENGHYFEPGMMAAANEHLGADSSSDFDWYGGPLSGVSRDMAGRKLLDEEVKPAFARGETVNLVAHSHGGNVLGEMAGSYVDRMQYLETLVAGGAGPEQREAALQAIAALQAERNHEREQLTSLAGRWSIDDPSEQHAQLDRELASLDADRQALDSGDTQALQDELELLRNGEFGDVMNLNTPYLKRHDAVTEVGPFADKVDSFTDVIGTRDPTAFGGRLHERLMGGGARTLPEHDRLETRTWDLDDPGFFDKRRHTGVLEEDVFRRKVLDEP